MGVSSPNSNFFFEILCFFCVVFIVIYKVGGLVVSGQSELISDFFDKTPHPVSAMWE